jgi:hypothetical protein
VVLVVEVFILIIMANVVKFKVEEVAAEVKVVMVECQEVHLSLSLYTYQRVI